MTEYGRKHTDGSRSGGQPPRLPSDSVVERIARATCDKDGVPADEILPNDEPRWRDRVEFVAFVLEQAALAAQPRDDVRETETRCPNCGVGFTKVNNVDEHLAALSQGDEQPDTDGLAEQVARDFLTSSEYLPMPKRNFDNIVAAIAFALRTRTDRKAVLEEAAKVGGTKAKEVILSFVAIGDHNRIAASDCAMWETADAIRALAEGAGQ